MGNGPAQTESAPNNHSAIAANNAAQQRKLNTTATIHWSGMTLHDAIGRLKSLYSNSIFIDRRIDPNLRIDLDLSATSTEQVLNALATGRDLGVVRLRNTMYVGPAQAAQKLPELIKQRSLEITRLPHADRATLMQRQPLTWERLSEPQKIAASLARTAGWKIANSDNIPFDLWDANALPDLAFAESLSLLLIGFDLTFELHPNDRTVHLIPLEYRLVNESQSRNHAPPKLQTRLASPQAKQAPTGAKQVFTLRVQEKPVGAVLRELARRLNWSLQIDETAIQAAGKSLDTRVSFSVENADREKLLDALLTPAGLEYRIEGTTVYVTPERYGSR
jgi:hypothetical protein